MSKSPGLPGSSNPPKPQVIKLNEDKRVYTFPGGYKIELNNVTEFFVSNSGNHRLKTADGKLHIVAPGWIHIEITDQKKEWTV
jgi:hypothetical protein